MDNSVLSVIQLSRRGRGAHQRPLTLFHTVVDDDAGMVTVEAAYALTALVTIAILCCGALGAGITQLRIVDYAHTLARTTSRTGTLYAPQSTTMSTTVPTIMSTPCLPPCPRSTPRNYRHSDHH